MPAEIVTQIPSLPPRAADAHKGAFGHVMVVGGCRGMGGAAALSGLGALRGGAGLVTVATAESAQPVVAVRTPCYMTIPLPADANGLLANAAEAPALAAAGTRDVLAVGPGLGSSPGVTQVVVGLLARSLKPTVLDADGLNAVVNRPEALRRRGSLVLTPHPGEFARLVAAPAAAVQADREAYATRFAGEIGCVVVLKGAGTLVTDGRKLYRNTTGNPGMATGGSGDVLTGVVAALIAQGLEPFAAAVLGTYVHGLAGDLARDEFGEVSMIASDIVDMLPRAFRQLSRMGVA